MKKITSSNCDNAFSVHIVNLFEEIANSFSSNIAIVEHNVQYSYYDIRNYMLYYQHQLMQSGVNAGDVIAIYDTSSLFTIVSMLAVWSIGAIVMPIDMYNMPTNRVKLLLSKIEAKFILTAKHFPDFDTEQIVIKLPLNNSVNVLYNSKYLQLKDKAYIFSTSGSTGEPKLILGSHNSFAHFLCWQRDQFHINNTDTGLLLTNISFDVILRDAFLPLISGATLHIVSQYLQYDVNGLFTYIDEQKITYLHVVPSKLKAWLNFNTKNKLLNHIRWLFSAGEKLEYNLVELWNKQSHNGTIVNLYGPTETTLAKCFYVINDTKIKVVPVGYPTPNTNIYIMHNGKLRIPMESGEVVIETLHGTYGYISTKSDMIATNYFKSDMTSSEKTLYYTGDVGYINEDGALVLQGRIDNQIKVNGVRIEPYEIEQTVLQISTISDCILLHCPIPQLNNKILVLFYIVLAQQTCDINTIRDHLQSFLPNYMIPDDFVEITNIPLNTNGKTDRLALINIFQNKLLSTRNDVQEKPLTDVLCATLGRMLDPQVGIFKQGIKSLDMVKIIIAIESKYNVELSPAVFHKDLTVNELAEHIHTNISYTRKIFWSFLSSDSCNHYVCFFPPLSGWNIIYKDLATLLPQCTCIAFDYLEDDDKIDQYVKIISQLCKNKIISIVLRTTQTL